MYNSLLPWLLVLVYNFVHMTVDLGNNKLILIMHLANIVMWYSDKQLSVIISHDK